MARGHDRLARLRAALPALRRLPHAHRPPPRRARAPRAPGRPPVVRLRDAGHRRPRCDGVGDRPPPRRVQAAGGQDRRAARSARVRRARRRPGRRAPQDRAAHRARRRRAHEVRGDLRRAEKRLDPHGRRRADERARDRPARGRRPRGLPARRRGLVLRLETAARVGRVLRQRAARRGHVQDFQHQRRRSEVAADVHLVGLLGERAPGAEDAVDAAVGQVVRERPGLHVGVERAVVEVPAGVAAGLDGDLPQRVVGVADRLLGQDRAGDATAGRRGSGRGQQNRGQRGGGENRERLAHRPKLPRPGAFVGPRSGYRARMDAEVFGQVLGAVREFVRKEVVPREAEIDERDEIPAEIREKAAELGLFGWALPEEYGGLGLGMAEDVRLAIELGHTTPAFRSLFGTNNGIAGQAIVHYGTPDQRTRWLPRLAAGQAIAPSALTEAEAGSDPGGLTSRAVRDGDRYRLSGTKRFITNAPLAEVFVTNTRTDLDSTGSRGISAFLVPAGAEGVSVGLLVALLGLVGAWSLV